MGEGGWLMLGSSLGCRCWNCDEKTKCFCDDGNEKFRGQKILKDHGAKKKVGWGTRLICESEVVDEGEP